MIGKYYRKDYASDEAFLQKQFELNDYCLNNNCCLGEGTDDNGYYLEVTDGAPTLEEVKVAKKKELKSARDRNDYYNITTNIGTFDFDTISQNRINNAITITTGSRNWTLADGTTATVTKEDLLNVIKAGAERSDRIHNKWLELEAQVNAAATVAEVEAIKWETVSVND